MEEKMSSSTRSRAEQRAFESQPEEIIRPETRVGLTEPARYNEPLRNRIERQREEPAETHPSNAAADMWADMHRREQERDAQNKRDEIAAQNKRKQEQQRANIDFQINIALGDASKTEDDQVRQIVRSNFPKDVDNPDRYKITLMRLRAELGYQQ
jgi:hypothetical protein